MSLRNLCDSLSKRRAAGLYLLLRTPEDFTQVSRRGGGHVHYRLGFFGGPTPARPFKAVSRVLTRWLGCPSPRRAPFPRPVPQAIQARTALLTRLGHELLFGRRGSHWQRSASHRWGVRVAGPVALTVKGWLGGAHGRRMFEVELRAALCVALRTRLENQ